MHASVVLEAVLLVGTRLDNGVWVLVPRFLVLRFVGLETDDGFLSFLCMYCTWLLK
jgi:hypothetical protein